MPTSASRRVWEGKAGNYNPKTCRETSTVDADEAAARARRRKTTRFVAFASSTFALDRPAHAEFHKYP